MGSLIEPGGHQLIRLNCHKDLLVFASPHAGL